MLVALLLLWFRANVLKVEGFRLQLLGFKDVPTNPFEISGVFSEDPETHLKFSTDCVNSVVKAGAMLWLSMGPVPGEFHMRDVEWGGHGVDEVVCEFGFGICLMHVPSF